MTAPELSDGSLAPGSGSPPEPNSVSGPPAPETPGLDLHKLAEHLAAKAPGLITEPLRAKLVTGGRSNLTYILNDIYVVRRPPLGHVLATAHDMAREFKVLSALGPTAVPVPETLLLCTDDSVLGAPFYLMARVPGVVYRHRSQTDPLGAEARRDLAFEMVDTLAWLHAVKPAEVGLADFGRPEGFLERQVRRWAGQLERSRSRDLPGADELRDRLAASVPISPPPAIVHGDFRLDNLMIDSHSMRVAAVLDWEMATLGDPLTDLGLLVTYWDVVSQLKLASGNPIADGLGPTTGFPSGTELLERYAQTSSTEPPDLRWYMGLACYKLAGVLEGIHFRYTQGKTVGAGFEQIGALVEPLLASGLTALDARGSDGEN
jgi:aminoglycoside phosphotransferase (APT) family kinase protein